MVEKQRKRPDTSPSYNLGDLKANVARCDNSIVLFQDAIRKERDNRDKLLRLIKEIEGE